LRSRAGPAAGAAALHQLLADADRGEELRLDCGACQACCHQKVVLVDEDPREYEAEDHGGVWFLKHHADGGCIYLTDAGSGTPRRAGAASKGTIVIYELGNE